MARRGARDGRTSGRLRHRDVSDTLDIWIEPHRDNSPRVLRALASFGSPTEVTADELAKPGLILRGSASSLSAA